MKERVGVAVIGGDIVHVSAFHHFGANPGLMGRAYYVGINEAIGIRIKILTPEQMIEI